MPANAYSNDNTNEPYAKFVIHFHCDYPEFVPMDLTTINRMQIALRKRELTFQEKSELHAIISNTSDNFLEICAFLLLDEQEEAQKLFGSLSEKQLREFKNSPIYRFCK